MNLVEAKKSFFTSKGRFFQIFLTLILCLVLYILLFTLDYIFQISEYIQLNVIFNKISEVFLLIVSFSIFLVSFITFPMTKNNRFLIAGFIFFTEGIFYWILIINPSGDFAGMISYEHPISAIFFWTIIRLLNGLSFVVFFAMKSESHSVLKRVIFFPGSIITVVVGYFIIRTAHAKPELLYSNNRFSVVSIIIIIFVFLLCLHNIYYAIKEYISTGEVVYRHLSSAFIFMFFGEITLLSIKHVSDFKSLLSQLFIMVSYSLMFYAFYIHSIRKPYYLLTKAKDELAAYLSELDELVDQRTDELRGMNEKLMADQEVARGMQLSMLPSGMPVDEYVSFASGYIPAENLSGDFYNVLKIDNYHFGICIGDVSGHGVSAAMLSIFTFQKMQSLMEETGREGMTIPSMVIKHLYESFNSANFNDDMYIVMLYGVYNTQTGILSYASGGLNTTPLRIRPDGSIQELDNDGFAICKLGEILKPKFVNHQVLLFPGDKLVLYTDGLIEARNSEGEEYSISRLKEIIKKNNKWGSERISEALIGDVKKFTGNRFSDDITLLVLDVLPPF